jgi:hypothetical protein
MTKLKDNASAASTAFYYLHVISYTIDQIWIASKCLTDGTLQCWSLASAVNSAGSPKFPPFDDTVENILSNNSMQYIVLHKYTR